MENVIDRIVKFCDHLGMSISSFAASIGVNQVTLNNYKLGKRKPSLELVEKVAKKYPEISLDWLINGIGSMCCSDVTDEEIFGGSHDKGSEDVKDERIKLLEERIAFLEEQVEFYKNKNT